MHGQREFKVENILLCGASTCLVGWFVGGGVTVVRNL